MEACRQVGGQGSGQVRVATRGGAWRYHGLWGQQHLGSLPSRASHLLLRFSKGPQRLPQASSVSPLRPEEPPSPPRQIRQQQGILPAATLSEEHLLPAGWSRAGVQEQQDPLRASAPVQEVRHGPRTPGGDWCRLVMVEC